MFFSSVPIDSNGKNLRVPNLFKLDSAGNVLQSKRVVTESNFEDAHFIDFRDIIYHPTKGIVCYGRTTYDESPPTSTGWISQLHPEDFRVLFDTATQIEQFTYSDLIYFENTIIAQGGVGASPYYLKLNLRDIDTYPAASVGEKPSESHFRVYPNPSITGNFRIEADVEITQIQVYSLTGQQLLDKNLNDFTNELSIKPKGVFILQVQTRDGEIHRSKIINQ